MLRCAVCWSSCSVPSHPHVRGSMHRSCFPEDKLCARWLVWCAVRFVFMMVEAMAAVLLGLLVEQNGMEQGDRIGEC